MKYTAKLSHVPPRYIPPIPQGHVAACTLCAHVAPLDRLTLSGGDLLCPECDARELDDVLSQLFGGY